MWCLKLNVSVAGTRSSALRPTTVQWVCWPGENPLVPAPPAISLPCTFAGAPHTIPLVVGERDLSPRDGPADWKSLGEVGAYETPPPKAPVSPPVGPGLTAQSGGGPFTGSPTDGSPLGQGRVH